MLWLGLGGGPYDASVFSVKGDFPVRDNVMLDLRGLVGTGPGMEYRLSAGRNPTVVGNHFGSALALMAASLGNFGSSSFGGSWSWGWFDN